MFKVIYKKCTKCGETKPISHFPVNNSRKDHKGTRCIDCQRKITRFYHLKYRSIDPKAWDARKRNYPKNKYTVYERNAKLKRVFFDLTFDEFMTFWQKPCYYCGAKIESIGLDRMDNDLGYTTDNIVPCCTTCNYLKKNLFDSDGFIDHCSKIAKKHKSF